MTKKTEADPAHPSLQPATRLVVGGRDAAGNHGFVNPPVHHVSTVLYPTAEDFLARRARYLYGRRGTPTSEALENALRALEGADCAGVALLPSGLAAISTALLAVLEAGDHLLVTDSAYQPTRKFCDGVLPRYGISTTYYDPLLGDGVVALFKPNTRAVFVESPGSLSFEIQDVPAIAAAAHARRALVLMDNTWASPLYFRAFDKGVDLSIQAATKYIGGHSDVMLGTISANKATWQRLGDMVHALGLCVGPDDIYLGLRGLRTMGVRLAQHHQAGLKVARWLEQRPEIARVLHPGLESHPGHAIWRRDFSGASGLFSIVFKPVAQRAVNAFLDELRLFGIGASWGGFESLAIPFDCAAIRTATRWAPGGPTVRIHIGLESVDDLLGDLERGFAALAAAR
ncbi:MAG TPA: cystathionine beta-lyase [Xanthobacteraceae bacterium]|jgi:cystathionine beta-lyase